MKLSELSPEEQEKRRNYYRQYAAANRDRINANQRLRYQRNPSHYQDIARKWRKNHSEQWKSICVRWREENPERWEEIQQKSKFKRMAKKEGAFIGN